MYLSNCVCCSHFRFFHWTMTKGKVSHMWIKHKRPALDKIKKLFFPVVLGTEFY